MFASAHPQHHEAHQHIHVHQHAMGPPMLPPHVSHGLSPQHHPHAAIIMEEAQGGASMKRKRNTNTLEKRVEVIGRIERKEITQAEGSRILGVGKAAVSRMMKDKDRIKEKMFSGNSKASAKRARSAAHPELEQRVFRFVDAMRKRKLNVPGSLIQSRALKEAERMEVTNFKASQGWLENFKLRFGLKNSTNPGSSSPPARVTQPGVDLNLLEPDTKDDELVDSPSPLTIGDVYDRILDIERFANTHNLGELINCTRQMWHILSRKTAERRMQTALSTVQQGQQSTDQQLQPISTGHPMLHQVQSPDLLPQSLVSTMANLTRSVRAQSQT